MRGGLGEHRKRLGYTQQTFVQAFAEEARKLGVRAAVSVRQLSRWEKPSPPLPHSAQQAVLEALLGVPIDELGFAVPEYRRAVSTPTAAVDNGTVERRRFVADITATTTAAVVPNLRTRVGAVDVRELRARMLGLYAVDHTAGGTPARRQALVLGQAITQRLTDGTCTGRVTRELQGMLGETHSHLAWFSRDAERRAEARAFCLDALAAARMVGDRLLEVRTFASLALLAVDRRNAWEAMSAATAAQDAARGHAGPTVRLVLALREASAAEVSGDLTAARRALSRALTFLGRTDTDADVPAWAAYAGAVEVDHAQGTYYLAAGSPRAAVPYLRAAADGLGGRYARNAAVYRAKLGLALLASGDAEAACGEVGAVLDNANRIRSRVMTARLAEFRDAAAHVDTAAAREIVERIRRVQEDCG